MNKKVNYIKNGVNSMGYDPNQWTKEFVVGNKDFCIRQIKGINNQVITCLKQGEHKAAITGIDRILNGLVLMINAGFDYRSHVCFFSWIEANIILFGDLQDAAEQNRINTARDSLLDARDFAKGETAKNSITAIIDDINNGYDISALTDKYAEDFPNFEIGILDDLNNKLDNAPGSATYVSAANRKKKPWWLIVVIIIFVFFAVIFLTDKELEVTSPDLKNTVHDTKPSTTQRTTTEAASDTNEAIPANIAGTWSYIKITEGVSSPDGEILPDIRTEINYCFHDNGTYSIIDATYEEASVPGQPYAENIDGRYWICNGGGGREGSYTVNKNQITLVSNDSIQYGPSTTTVLTFTLDGDDLILKHDYDGISENLNLTEVYYGTVFSRLDK